MNQVTILVIDDEEQMQELLKITLETNEFVVRFASSAKEGLNAASTHPPDLILLDIGLPDESGHVVLQKLREWYTRPVIILSVQNSEEDIVKALNNGANDYLIKPFRTAELIARMNSALRGRFSETIKSQIRFGEFSIDLVALTVKRNTEFIKLTPTEYALLALLVSNAGTVLTHHYLLKEIWGPTYIGQSQYLRIYVAQLRKKIELNPDKPIYLITEAGVGYRFNLN